MSTTGSRSSAPALWTVSLAERGGEGGGVEVEPFLDLRLGRWLCAAAVVEDKTSSEISGTIAVMMGPVLICATGTFMTLSVTSLEGGESEVGEGGFVMEGAGRGVVNRGFFEDSSCGGCGEGDVDFMAVSIWSRIIVDVEVEEDVCLLGVWSVERRRGDSGEVGEG